ncbi:MAG: STAS domain-containing protein [Rubrivivax sp.]|nr:STAS domain-containing protein [Rubrivivax sp.]
MDPAFALPTTLTIAEASEVLRRLEAAAAGGSGVFTVDAGALRDLDSAALAVLIEARRIARARARDFELRAAPPKLIALAELYGVAPLLAATPASST